MVIIKETVSEERFYSFQMDENTTAGMTYKNAGNFYPNSSNEKAFELAEKALKITGFYPDVSDKLIIMRAKNHSDEVICFPDNSMLKTTQLFCDGVIYRGAGAVIFFPGGCPAISFRDIKANLSGMLHGGWKPITKGIIKKFLNEWQKAGGKPENTKIKFLPAICDRCLTYENEYFYSVVYPSLLELLKEKTVYCLYSHNDKKIYFHLNFLIEYLLRKNGYEGISSLSECTCGYHQKYWCYRHNDKGKEKYRNSAFIITL